MANRFERRRIASDQSAHDTGSETQPNPDLVVAETGFVAWNVPDRRRAAFRRLRDIVRWGITIRAPEVRMLGKEIEYRIGDLESVRRLTNTEMFCALVV